MADKQDSETVRADIQDLDLIASSYRSMIDTDSFDDMLISWNQKFQGEESIDGPLALPSSIRAQFSTIEDLLKQYAMEPARDPMSAAISDFASAAIVLSPERRVMTLNDQASAKFGAKRGLVNALNWLDPTSRADFDAILRSAVGRGNRVHAILRVLSDEKPCGYSLAEAFVLRVTGHDTGYVIVRSLDLDWSDAIAPLLSNAFGLTDTETEICRLLYLYSDTDLIAEERGTSRLTIRTQIKSILTKTNTPNKVDLIRLLAVLCARQARKGKIADWEDPLHREQLLAKPDGGVLAWTWFGAPAGTPVLMIHGPSIGPYFSDQLDEWMKKANIRLLAISRPGYGNSTPDISQSPINEQASAIQHFCTSFGLRDIIGVGIGCGIAPLLKLANQQKNPFRRLVHFGNFLPLNNARIKHHPKLQQTFFRLAKQAPWALEMVVKLGFRVMLQKGIDWYLERAYSESAFDLASCRNPELAPLIRNGCAHMMRQDARAFSRDLALVWEPIDDWLKGLNIPLAWYVGTHHGGFDPDVTASITRVVRDLTFEVVDHSGELLVYQRPDIVADRIIYHTHKALERA